MMRSKMDWAKSGWMVWSGVAVAVVLLASNYPYFSRTAQGDVRETPRPEMFLSGGARSEVVLKEVLETLKRIDARLERFEKALRDAEPEANRQPAAQAEPGGAMVEQQVPGGAVGEMDPAK